MVWAGVCYGQRTHVQFIDSILNAQRYHNKRSWGLLLCHSSTTITSCCSMIMHSPMLQVSIHNSRKLKTSQFLHGQHTHRTCHPLSMFGMLWIGVYDSVFQLLPISSNFAKPLKGSGSTFHRPQSTTWSTLCEGDVLHQIRTGFRTPPIQQSISWIFDIKRGTHNTIIHYIFHFKMCTYQTCEHILVYIIYCVFAILYIAYLYTCILFFYYLCKVLRQEPPLHPRVLVNCCTREWQHMLTCLSESTQHIIAEAICCRTRPIFRSSTKQNYLAINTPRIITLCTCTEEPQNNDSSNNGPT